MEKQNVISHTITRKAGRLAAERLAIALQSHLDEDCHEYTVNIRKPLGCGTIKMIDFFTGLSLLLFDIDLQSPLEILFENKSNCLLRFSYCLEGKVAALLQDNKIKLSINAYGGVIHADSIGSAQKILLEPERTRFLCIEIDREKYLEKIRCEVKHLPAQFEEIFLDTDCQKHFLYQHNYLHSIQETALEIYENDFDGIVRRTFVESGALEIISQQVLQFIRENEESTRLIRQIEVDQLEEAKRILKNHLKDGISIRELSRKVGLNQNKLKYGFKKVFGQTINGCLLKMRLDKARLLIATNGLSLRQVAEEVGYENKSYFARKFRERYGVLPRDFRKEVTDDL